MSINTSEYNAYLINEVRQAKREEEAMKKKQ
jgi:hypothetical protein